MDIHKSTDSDYIEMTRHGLDINMEDDGDYDVIPANFVQTRSTPIKLADEKDLTPVSCHPPVGIETAHLKGKGTLREIGGSRWRTYFRLGLAAALVCLSVGVTLVIIHTDIPKRVIATVSTDAKPRHRILRLTPANRRPLDFTYRIRDAIRYPFRVNRRGMLTVSDALTAKKYEFIVKITDRRSKQSVKITVVIRCQDPSVSVFSSYTVESSFPEVYTHPGFSSITTIYPRWQVSENLTLTPTPSSTVPISDFQNPPSRDPSSITTIHTQTGKDVATKVESSGVFFSSVPDFWTVFSVAEQVSTVQTIYSTLDSHYLAFSSMHKMQTDLMHTFNQTN